MKPNPPASRWPRRRWIAAAGLGATSLAAAALYRSSSPFLRMLAKDFIRTVEPSTLRPTPQLWPDRGLHAAWLGHSTLLLKADGFTVLTDPVLFPRIGLDLGLFTFGPRRLVAPALDSSSLPPIDLILLSHAHMDHMDLPTLRALQSPRTHVVTARATSDLLNVPAYASVQEVGWNQSVRVGPASIRGLEVNHWGARMHSDTFRGYNGYLLQIGAHRILFAGDTANTDAFRHVSGAHLAFMPIGAYQPWIRAHCSPEQAWRMANDARADIVAGIHHQTFRLSQEPSSEPLHRLLSAAGSAAHSRIALHSIGSQLSLS